MRAAFLQQLHAARCLPGVASKRMPSSTVCCAVAAVGQRDLDRHDLVLERAALGGGDGALVAVEARSRRAASLRQAVLLRDHLGADELAELDVRIALLHLRALSDVPKPFFAGSCMDGPIGTRVMLSTPAAITTSMRARHHRLRREVQRLLRRAALPVDVVAGTLSGSFEASTALRATLRACSPTWLTQPMITSSISAGSMPVRSTSASRTLPARSAGCQPDEPARLAARRRCARRRRYRQRS